MYYSQYFEKEYKTIAAWKGQLTRQINRYNKELQELQEHKSQNRFKNDAIILYLGEPIEGQIRAFESDLTALRKEIKHANKIKANKKLRVQRARDKRESKKLPIADPIPQEVLNQYNKIDMEQLEQVYNLIQIISTGKSSTSESISNAGRSYYIMNLYSQKEKIYFNQDYIYDLINDFNSLFDEDQKQVNELNKLKDLEPIQKALELWM